MIESKTSSLPALAPVRFVDSSASLLFDLLRGLAALIVVFEHWRNIFFVDYQQLPKHSALLLPLYILSGAGHQAVIVFFLLSGFFIGGSVLSSTAKNRWVWSDYLLRRFVRLWIVLIPALLLAACWDWSGIRMGHAPGLYHGDVANHMIANVEMHLSPRIFLANLFFLQTILASTFGSDGALWSLANEFWYYLLFPLGFFAIRKSTKLVPRIVCVVLFLAAAVLTHGGILNSFPIWLAGVALVKIPAPKFAARRAGLIRILASIVYVPIFFGLSRLHGLPSLANDYVLTVVSFGYLWVLLSAKSRHGQGAKEGATRGLARFSYTLYAVHIPLLVFLASLMVGDNRWLPTAAHLGMGVAPFVAVIVYAYAIAFCTEFRTDVVRGRLEKVLGLHVARSPLPSDPAKV
jgi:peptidoglycan/LPS O-acetylase OafA/YrhL